MSLTTLAQIANAVNAAEGRYDPKSCRQVSDIRCVGRLDNCCAYYVVLGKTFRTVSAFSWAYAVEVTKNGIHCHSESDARNAEAAAYMLMDKRRATPSVEEV
jgi:hypothetical protein